jgi:hypothetical protein
MRPETSKPHNPDRAKVISDWDKSVQEAAKKAQKARDDAQEALVDIAQLLPALKVYVQELAKMREGPSQITSIMSPSQGPSDKPYVVGYEVITPFQYDRPLNPIQYLVATHRQIKGELKVKVVYTPRQELKEGHTASSPGNPWGDINLVRDREGHPMSAYQKRQLEFDVYIMLRWSNEETEQTDPMFITTDINNDRVSPYVVLAEENYDLRGGGHRRLDYPADEVQLHIKRFLETVANDWLSTKLERINTFLGRTDKQKHLSKN